MAEIENHKTTNHEEIRTWAEKRDAHPAIVKGNTAVLSFTFDNVDTQDLEIVDWDAFFDLFEENNLALVYQEETSSGELSRYNKFVRR